MVLEEGDIVLCTVDKITGTIIFVKIEEDGEGSIITSEIAPGRIRNLRAYVVPKKKIVCKVLRISSVGDIHLSLRRVTQKERKEVLEQYKQEKKSASILKSVLGEKTDKIIKEIKKQTSITEFLKESKKNSKILEKLVDKKDAKKILKILKLEKQKKAIIKKEFYLKTTKSNGLNLIKEILDIKDAEIKYISAGKYSIKIESTDLKTADNKLQKILKNIEDKAKKQKMEFKIKEK